MEYVSLSQKYLNIINDEILKQYNELIEPSNIVEGTISQTINNITNEVYNASYDIMLKNKSRDIFNSVLNDFIITRGSNNYNFNIVSIEKYKNYVLLNIHTSNVNIYQDILYHYVNRNNRFVSNDLNINISNCFHLISNYIYNLIKENNFDYFDDINNLLLYNNYVLDYREHLIESENNVKSVYNKVLILLPINYVNIKKEQINSFEVIRKFGFKVFYNNDIYNDDIILYNTNIDRTVNIINSYDFTIRDINEYIDESVKNICIVINNNI